MDDKPTPTMQVQSNIDARVASLPIIGQFVNSVSVGNLFMIVFMFVAVAMIFGYVPTPWVTRAEMHRNMQRIEVLFKIQQCQHETDLTSKKVCWDKLKDVLTPLDTP